MSHEDVADEGDQSKQEPVVGFDQTNGLAGNLVGDDDETTKAEDDDPTDVGSIYTGLTGRDGERSDPDGSDGEEPI